MVKSMTGFGAGRGTAGNEEVSVELRSVNHKFCEVKIRIPRELAALELATSKQIKLRLTRGSVDVVVKRTLKSAAGLVPVVDLELAREYHRVFRQVASELKLAEEPLVRDIVAQPNVLRLEEPQVDLDNAARALEQALATALDSLSTMRDREGQALLRDVGTRVDLVATLVAEVASLAPQSVTDYREALAARVDALSRGLPVDPARLAQEVVLFAERTDVAEELTRLNSHLAQFRTVLASGEPAGRTLDFLVQEMHREVNTTASKSQSAEISARTVALKAELERLREQVQNIE